MLEMLNGFRDTISDIMLKALRKRVILYGYGYTGRFLKWYAEYYHGIEVAYTIEENLPYQQPYDLELFTPALFNVDYKDIKDCVVWLAVPQTKEIRALMETHGFIEGETYFDFYKAVYGEDIIGTQEETDIFHKRKTGKRDIQFLEWLEWKYNCNFLTAITVEEMRVVGENMGSYRVTTQKELFSILERFHIRPTAEDAIFDFGCGKGGTVVSFLDYGFDRAGGIEYEPGIYEAYRDNIEKLGL